MNPPQPVQNIQLCALASNSGQCLERHLTAALCAASQARDNYTALGEVSSAATSRYVQTSIAYGIRWRLGGDEISSCTLPATGAKASLSGMRLLPQVPSSRTGDAAPGQIPADGGYVSAPAAGPPRPRAVRLSPAQRSSAQAQRYAAPGTHAAGHSPRSAPQPVPLAARSPPAPPTAHPSAARPHRSPQPPRQQ